MSITEENWNYHVSCNKIENMTFRNFELLVNEVRSDILKLLEESFLQNIDHQFSTAQSYDEDHKLLMNKNRQLRQEIETKLKELSLQQTQYENYKQDQKLLSQEVKDTHETFLMAKKYYRKFLKIYFFIESTINDEQVIIIQFFTEAKKDSESYSAKLIRDLKSKQYKLVSTIPRLSMLKELQGILLESNDLLGALYSIREEFLIHKKLIK